MRGWRPQRGVAAAEAPDLPEASGRKAHMEGRCMYNIYIYICICIYIYIYKYIYIYIYILGGAQTVYHYPKLPFYKIIR